ncbi:MAG TPA: hypothetical protein VMF65_06835 [Acidimicrobiales bacterium]|nr:hypothetical protein [Acidimicrobiales bacterium]
MQTTCNICHNYSATPILGVVIGALYLIAFSIGGQPLIGVVCLSIMVVFSVVIALAGRHSETVRGLLDHRDERIAGMDLAATGTAAVAMIIAVSVGFIVSVG